MSAGLAEAIIIATNSHAFQSDKAGHPYILHPLRVMFAMPDDEVFRVVAVLHDVVEDTTITFDALRREGFSDEVVDAVNALTHRDHESYEAFIRRAAMNEIARVVKRADILDNLDPVRMARLPYADADRLTRKYRTALVVLSEWEE